MSAEPSEPPSLKKGSKLIKNGVIDFEVTDLESAKSRIDTLLEQVEVKSTLLASQEYICN